MSDPEQVAAQEQFFQWHLGLLVGHRWCGVKLASDSSDPILGHQEMKIDFELQSAILFLKRDIDMKNEGT